MKTSTYLLLVGLCALADGMKLEEAPITLAAQEDESTLLAGDAKPKDDPKPDDKKDEGVKVEKVPFGQNVVFESVGLFLMIILVTLSNAGGLSGAGSNIPIMLIFFGLTMNEAVPVSSFVAVSSTLFRFILNFSEKHPTRPERNTINYEIVLIVMPAVFFGSFVGVLLGNVLSEITKVVMFGTTVAWSIYTTSKKAIELLAKEKKAAEIQNGQESAIGTTTQLIDDNGEANPDENKIPELETIQYEERYHFTCQKVSFIGVCFIALLATQTLFGSKATKSNLPDWARYTVFASFAVLMLLMTTYSV